MTVRTTAIIQARAGSTRLPGKIFADLGGLSILGWVVRAANAAALIDTVVVATSTDPSDDRTAELCAVLGVRVVRGPEDDVLSRFLIGLQAFPCDLVVRLTADCPLLDPRIIDAAISVAQGPARPDYVSSTLVRSLPRGLDVEVVRAEVLATAGVEAMGHDRVHVTSYIYTHPERFECLGVSTPLQASDLRVTVDTSEDLAVVRGVVQELGAAVPVTAAAVVQVLQSHPELVAINAHVEQKQPAEG